MTRILLIEPPTPSNSNKVMRIIGSIGTLKARVLYPPIDHAILGGLLRKHNIDFKIIDALNTDMNWEDVKKTIKEENPEAVVYTNTIPTLDNDNITATIAKQVNPNIKTITINFLNESCRYNILERYKDVDFVAIRDYEFPVLNLIKNDYEGKKVKGIYYRENGEVIKNSGDEYCLNLDDLGIPAHDMLPLNIYQDFIMKRKPMTITLCTRGCINANNCNHCCAKYLNPLRIRSIENVVQEMKFMKKIGIKEIAFWDSEIPFEHDGTKQKWIWKLLERMKEEKFDFSMYCNVRSDCVNYDILKAMKETGFHTLKLGADSSSQTILNNMNKNETAEQIEQAVKDIRKVGFNLLIYCTMGHKGETKETMKNTIDWVTNKLKPDWTTFSLAVPVYGTVFYDYLKKNSFLIEDKEGDQNAPPTYSYPHLSSKEMYKIAMDGYKNFYLRKSYIIKRLPKLLRHPFFEFKNGLYFIKRYVFEPTKI
jgi:radical SAM superfamily enzyme YgiQ (UPF0313 family)